METRIGAVSMHAERALGMIMAAGLLLDCSGHEALAHDHWMNGDPMPAWVRKLCCGVADAHHLQSSQVHVTVDGYRVDGYSRVIPQQQRLTSPDGEWWVFYRVLDNGEDSYAYCFFGPDEGS